MRELKVFIKTLILSFLLFLALFGIVLVIQGANELSVKKEEEHSIVSNVESEPSKTVHVEYDLAGHNDNGTSKLLEHYMESCEDVVARLYIEDTKMETPLVNSDYYFRRNLAGEYATEGTPYIQTMDCFMKNNHNAVIYGHRLDNGEDFGMLEQYLDQSFLDAHQNIMIETSAGTTSWSIISVFPIDVDKESFDYSKCEDFNDVSVRNYFMSEIEKRNVMLTNDYTYQENAQLITLSTCYYPTDPVNGRLVIVAVRK